MQKQSGLTQRQREVLRALDGFIKVHQYAPSLRELGSNTDIAAVSNVSFHLKHLEEKGMIVRPMSGSKRDARAIRLTPRGAMEVERGTII